MAMRMVLLRYLISVTKNMQDNLPVVDVMH